MVFSLTFATTAVTTHVRVVNTHVIVWRPTLTLISALCHLSETPHPAVSKYPWSVPADSDRATQGQSRTLRKWYLGILEIGILSVTTPGASNMTVQSATSRSHRVTLLAGARQEAGEEDGDA